MLYAVYFCLHFEICYAIIISGFKSTLFSRLNAGFGVGYVLRAVLRLFAINRERLGRKEENSWIILD